MSQPPPYVPATSFISYQAQQSWFPGQQLDAEFNNLDTIIGDIEANLALIQRDDGALLNGIVTYDSLSTALQTSGLSGLTAWTSGVVFNEGQVVIDGAGIYTATGTHTSSASFAVDLAANWWELSSTIPTVSGVNGVLSFARLAKTANYTLANTDKGVNVALGGNSFYTLTVPAASGFDANFAVTVVNEDGIVSSGRAKYLSIAGGTPFYLWPGQSVLLYNDNNTWQTLGAPARIRLPVSVNVTIHFDPSLGSDTDGAADGLSTGVGAFKTAQRCFTMLQRYFDCATSQITVLNASGGADISGVHLPFWGLVGGNGGDAVKLDLNGGSISVSGDYAIACFFGMQLSIRNGTIGNGTGGGISCTAGGRIWCEDVLTYGAAAAGFNQIFCTTGGHVFQINNYSISGGGAAHMRAAEGGIIQADGITASFVGSANTITYTNAVLSVSTLSVASLPTWVNGAAVNAGTTVSYSVSQNGVAIGAGAGGTAVPGSAGSTATGGQV